MGSATATAPAAQHPQRHAAPVPEGSVWGVELIPSDHPVTPSCAGTRTTGTTCSGRSTSCWPRCAPYTSPYATNAGWTLPVMSSCSVAFCTLLTLFSLPCCWRSRQHMPLNYCNSLLLILLPVWVLFVPAGDGPPHLQGAVAALPEKLDLRRQRRQLYRARPRVQSHVGWDPFGEQKRDRLMTPRHTAKRLALPCSLKPWLPRPCLCMLSSLPF